MEILTYSYSDMVGIVIFSSIVSAFFTYEILDINGKIRKK